MNFILSLIFLTAIHRFFNKPNPQNEPKGQNVKNATDGKE